MADLFERIRLLKNSPLFAHISTDDLRYVAQVMSEEVFLEGERVVTIDEQGDHMYVVLHGRIGISRSPDPAAMDLVDTIGEGDFFGEMNLLDELPRSATAHVLEECRLLCLEKEKLHGLIMSYPELSLGMLKGLSLRLREAHKRDRP